ncbi:MAG: hypothetical protein AB8H86_00700 [Polyangiales bacterium]
MRAVWIIACVLAVTGSVYAQTPAPDAVEAAVEVEAAVPSGDEGDATANVEELAPSVESETPSDTAPVEVLEADEEDESDEAPRIERIESSGSEVVNDDLPPSLQRESVSAAISPQSPRAPLSPWKGYFGFGSGLALHLNAQDEFQQNTLAPAYLSLRGGGVLPGQGRLRHALQLGIHTNLSREGAYPSGTLALRQWVLVPSYVLRMGLDASPLPAWIATARVGLPIVVSPAATLGAELAFGAQYFARSGVGIFAELIYDVFVGGRERDGSRSTHHLLTIEVGLQFELEVLP